jgi:hypothetical protein
MLYLSKVLANIGRVPVMEVQNTGNLLTSFDQLKIETLVPIDWQARWGAVRF